MSDHPSLLREIVLNPDDDLPRLIYADWLEEQGSPRGELIRLQCRLAELNEWDEEFLSLKNRSDVLISEFESEWISPEIQKLAKQSEWRRGFPEKITVFPGDLVKMAPSLLESHPLSGLECPALSDDWPRLANWNGLLQIRSLTLTGALYGRLFDDLRRFLKSDLLVNLEELNCGNLTRNCTEAILESMMDSPFLAKLKRLELPRGGNIGWVLLSRFSHSDLLSQLESLSLTVFPTVDGWRDLFRSPLIRNLRHLELNAQESLSHASLVQELAECPYLPHLESLRLRRIPVEEGSWRQLTRSSHFQRLRRLELELSNSWLLDPFSLLGTSSFPHLRCLRILDGLSTKESVESFLAAPWIDRLSKLELSGCFSQGRAAVNPLTECDRLQSLQSLALRNNHLGDEMLEALADSSLLESLLELNLAENEITSRGAAALAESPSVSNLLILDLSRCRLGRTGLQKILNSPSLSRLNALRVSVRQQLDDTLLEKLRERFGNRIQLAVGDSGPM